MRPDTSPTARALLALEAIQDSPGITAQRLGEHLGVSERAARRYVAILREADLPIESATGPNGGYRVGRGLRLPPLMFSAAEALGLVMAVLAGHRDAADPTELVGAALSKILRVLPQPVAEPLRAVRRTTGLQPEEHRRVDATITGQLVEACSRARRIHLTYRLGPETERPMEVDPWAVVLRHSRWYLFGYSHTRQAVRALRVDRIRSVFTTSQTFTPPQDLDALRALEEHLSQGWRHPVDVLFHDSFDDTARWVPRSLGRLEEVEGGVRLRATTDNPEWYARQLAVTPLTFEVHGSPPLVQATEALASRLSASARCGPPQSRTFAGRSGYDSHAAADQSESPHTRVISTGPGSPRSRSRGAVT